MSAIAPTSNKKVISDHFFGWRSPFCLQIPITVIPITVMGITVIAPPIYPTKKAIAGNFAEMSLFSTFKDFGEFHKLWNLHPAENIAFSAGLGGTLFYKLVNFTGLEEIRKIYGFENRVLFSAGLQAAHAQQHK